MNTRRESTSAILSMSPTSHLLERAKLLTEGSKGKHHIGDFLPPEELEKFVEKVQAKKEGREAGGSALVFDTIP